MRTTSAVLCIVTGWALTGTPAPAQTFPPGYLDPEPILQAAEAAIGTNRLSCVTLTGSGYSGLVGQQRLNDKNVDWPPVPSPEEAEEVAVDTVRKSSRIALAISAARARGVRVRYFSTDHVSDEVQPWLTSGDRGTATIVNAARFT